MKSYRTAGFGGANRADRDIGQAGLQDQRQGRRN